MRHRNAGICAASALSFIGTSVSKCARPRIGTIVRSVSGGSG
jgi:hypothetical protein